MLRPLTRVPRSAVHRLNHRKLGLKLGAEEALNRQHARFMTRNVIRYVMVMKEARRLRSKRMVTWAMARVRKMA